MAALFADDNVPLALVELLRDLGHDALTALQAVHRQTPAHAGIVIFTDDPDTDALAVGARPVPGIQFIQARRRGPATARWRTTTPLPSSIGHEIDAHYRGYQANGGVPCLRGLRIPVATVVGMVADEMTHEEILRAFPDWTSRIFVKR
jgi:hypothetical protein